MARSFKETFVAVDMALLNEPLIDPMLARTTACVALLQDKRLTISNAGDSRCVCARRVSANGGSTSVTATTQLVALDLTKDQNPDVPEEISRIMDYGGYVTLPAEPGLSARIWLDAECTQIGLAMARSIGDHAIAQVGVIAEPVVTTHDVTPDDVFLILASDGVWEFLSSADAVEIVAANLSRGATKACQALIEAAAMRWHEEEGAYRDDITAIVVCLQNLWPDS
jgi:protein phosphatase PTC2/3